MSSIVNFAEYLKNVIQAGQAIEGNVVKIIADNGREVGDAVFKVIQGGNGVSNEVGVAVETSTATATTTGLAYMAVDVGVAGAAIAPALGVLAGVGLYSLAPEFWTNVSNALVEAGQTVGGKVIAFWDGDNVNFDEQTIEIYKNALLDAGIFENSYDPTIDNNGITTTAKAVSSFNSVGVTTISARLHSLASKLQPLVIANGFYDTDRNLVSSSEIVTGFSSLVDAILNLGLNIEGASAVLMYARALCANSPNYLDRIELGMVSVTGDTELSIFNAPPNGRTKGLYFNKIIESASGLTYYYDNQWHPGGAKYTNPAIRENFILDYPYNNTALLNSVNEFINPDSTTFLNIPVFCYVDAGLGEYITNPNVQPGATVPTSAPFPGIYPGWLPWEYPVTVPSTDLPTVYPVKYPETEPDPYPTQDPAQNPDPEPYPVIIPVINPSFPLPQPNPDPTPEPEPTPDPDPQPDPDPLPEPEAPDPTPDPVDPNPDPTPSPTVPIVPLPATVASNKLFTVYNPSESDLNDLGAYLWDSSIMASIRDIWQDPLDGVISLIQIYATPVISGTHNIILGFLDSGVTTNVVGSQFVSVDCGSVSVPENKLNATDYAPYTSLHLYLPFIGIVELDTNECMKSTINVKYKIDVYTGTCLATVSVTRTEDMPNSPILYTYSGNCSQQIPLTSGNATGMFSALIGGITAGLSVASGGGLGVLAGASIAGQSLTHEMFHVSHSGNISANAGIMGQKKPYLIIGRRHGYDANNYSALYGFPANKTVVLGNHTGYVKVKKCFLKTTATQPEHDEILSILENGVIL